MPVNYRYGRKQKPRLSKKAIRQMEMRWNPKYRAAWSQQDQRDGDG